MAKALIAEIGADTSGFEAGLRRADASAAKFGKQIAGKLNAAFGIGVLTASITSSLRQRIADAEAITSSSARLKVTTDEYQALNEIAKDYHTTVEDLIKSHQDEGTTLSRLVPLMEQYRSKIQMTADEIKELNQFSSSLKEFGKGAASPLSWLTRGIFGLGAGAIGMGAGALSALAQPFGVTVGGIKPEDWFYEAKKMLGDFENLSENGAPLPLPYSNRERRRLNRLGGLTENLRILESQESAIRADGSRRASIWNVQTSGMQSGGAFIRRPGMIIEESRETNNKLEEVRKAITEVKAEIEKLNRG